MNFLKSVADKAKSAVDSLESPTRSLSGSGQIGSESFDGDSNGQEGFLCPMCMSRFAGPDQLQQHFEDKHSEGGQDNGHNNEDGFVSAENGFKEEEKILLYNQIKALEESKSLMSMEVVNLRSKLEDATKTQMDEIMLERTNQLAAENVTLKASLDEMSSFNSGLEERCQVLESEKLHRNSIDDASVLKQELISVQRTMDQTLQEKEVQLRDLVEENAILKTEMESKDDTLNQNTTNSLDHQINLELQLTENKQSIDSLNTTLQLKENKIRDLEKSCDIHSDNQKVLKQKCDSLEIRLKQEDCEIDNVTSEMERAKQALEAEKSTNQELESCIESLKKERSQLEGSLGSSEANLTKLMATNQQSEKDRFDLEENVKRLTGEREQLLKQIEEGEGSNLAIQQLTKENSSLQGKLSELNTSISTTTQDHNQEINSLSSQLSAVKEQCNNYELEKEKGNKELSRIGVEKKESDMAASRLNEELQNKTNQLNDLNKKIDSLSNECNQKTSEISVLQNTGAKLKEELVKAQTARDENINKVDNVTKEKDAFKTNLDSLEKVVSQKDKDISSMKKDMEDSKSQYEEKSAKILDLEDGFKILQVEVKDRDANIGMLKDAKQYLEQKNHELEEAKISLEARREEVDHELEEAREKIDELMADGESEKNRVQGLQTVLSATEVKVQEMRSAIDEAMGKEKSLLSDIEQKSKTISAIEMEKSSIVSNLESNQSTLELLRKEKDEFESLFEIEKKEKQELEEQSCKLQGKWEVERSKHEENLEEFKTARELLINQVVELKESLGKDKSANELKLGALQTKLDEEQQELSVTRATLQETELMHANFKDKCFGVEKNLKDELDLIKTNMSDVESRLQEATAERNKQQFILNAAVVERDAASSKLLELEAAVGAATEERRGLLERCLAAEAETERSRNLTVELRRKMEDSQAALHELGRENQSLQMEVSRQSGRKWKDDSDTMNCHSCSGPFNLTNRKHHCRNCGNIFCNNCSSKQTTMDGFKKPQRVCEFCFVEIGNK